MQTVELFGLKLIFVIGLVVVSVTGWFLYRNLWDLFDEMLTLKRDLRKEAQKRERIYKGIKQSLKEMWENEDKSSDDT